MLSYSKWKILNESLAGNISLGIKSPSSLGYFGNLPLDEAKKKSKKLMKGEIEVVSDAGDEEEEEDLEGEEESPCGFCNKKSKKKSRKYMGSEMMGKPSFKMGKPSFKKPLHKGTDWEDEGSEEDEEGMEDMGDEGDEEGMEDMGDEGDEEGMEDMGDEEDPSMMSNKGHPALKGGLNKKKMPSPEAPMFMKKRMRKEAFSPQNAEEKAWWNSVKSQIASDPNKKYNDGWTEYQEEALYPPDDPNANVREPGPGEVGFAPQARVATWEGTPIDGFNESRKRK